MKIKDMSFEELLTTEGDEYFNKKANRNMDWDNIEMLKSKTFVVFGTSDISEEIITYLKSRDKSLDIYCFARNADLHGTYFCDAQVISYDEGMKKNSLDNFIFLVVDWPSNNNDCIEFLIEKNVPEEQIYTKHEFLLSDKNYLEYFSSIKPTYYVYVFKHNENYKLISQNLDKINAAYNLFSDELSLYLFKERVLYNGNENISLLEKFNIMLQYISCVDYQYFDEIICNQKENSVFFDCGCYDSKTAIQYAKIVRDRYKKIISFEPMDEAFEISVKNSKEARLHDHIILKSGLYDSKCTLNFSEDSQGSKIDDNGSVSIDVTTIDSVVEEYNLDDVGFIKMDIEGSEEKALLGAAKTIGKFQPNLAICLYHKVDDFYELPLLIKKLNPNYKLTIRKYQFDGELVCYATAN